MSITIQTAIHPCGEEERCRACLLACLLVWHTYNLRTSTDGVIMSIGLIYSMRDFSNDSLMCGFLEVARLCVSCISTMTLCGSKAPS